jgi:hypothetical protein
MSQRLTLCTLTLLLASCGGGSIPGLGPDSRTVQKEADSKAIGGACRYALRGIEDCYTLNPTAVKSHIFTGWKDMDAYMRENKIEGVPSTVPVATPEGAAAKEPVAETAPEVKSKSKAKSKAGAEAEPAAH